MGISMRASPSQRIGLYQRNHERSFTLTCTFCRQPIHGESQRVPLKDQLADLESRAQNRSDRYSHCFDCRQNVSFDISPTWRKKVDMKIRYLFRLMDQEEKRKAKLVATQEWPAGTSSLVGEYWSGDCPYSHSEMFLNTSDRFECPTCRIQIGTDGRAHVLRLKGLGEFKTKERNFDSMHKDRISAVDVLPGVGAFEIKEDHRVCS